HVHSLLWFVLPIAMVALLIVWIFPQRSKERRVAGFLLVGFVLITAGVFVLPGAVRIHHAVLAYPFPQLIVAAACTFLWQRRSSRLVQRGTRVAIFVALLFLIASQIQAIRTTEQLLSKTGGRGWWSNIFDDFCRQNAGRADLTIISLDWGFNEQLAFLTNGPKLLESFWMFPMFREGLPPVPQEPQNLYLAHSPEYSLLRYDLAYLDAARSDDHAEVQAYSDKQGQIVFYTIRFRDQYIGRGDLNLFLVFVDFGFDRRLDFFVERLVVFQNLFRRVAALGELCTLIIQPGTTFFDDLFFQREIEQRASRRNPLVIHDVELRFGNRRGSLGFHNLNAGPISGDDAVGLLDRADPSNVDTHAGIEFQRLTARRGLRVTKHHTDFFPDLICENAAGPRF